MRSRQATRQLHAKLNDLTLRQRALLQPLVQRGTGHILHHDVVDSFVRREFVNQLYVGMVQPAQHERLMPKALSAGGIAKHLLVQDLDGNIAFQPQVAGTEYDPHTALTDALQQAEVA